MLLQNSITGWNLKRAGEDVPCDKRNLNDFLKFANPTVVDLIEKEVRKFNPWLLTDMTVEEIDKEIASLEEMKVKLQEQEAGNVSSGSK